MITNYTTRAVVGGEGSWCGLGVVAALAVDLNGTVFFVAAKACPVAGESSRHHSAAGHGRAKRKKKEKKGVMRESNSRPLAP